MNPSHGKKITKNIFLESIICPTKGWYLYNDYADQNISVGEQLRRDEGKEIGELAIKLYPNGVLVDGHGYAATQKTQKLIDDPSVDILFEGSFVSGKCTARPDILIREGESWHLIEVKSSSNYSLKCEKKQFKLSDDLAYTFMVISDLITIHAVSIMTLSEKFRLGMQLSELFVIHDVTEAVTSEASEFSMVKVKLIQKTTLKAKPDPSWIYACKNCDFFKTKCLGKNVENSIFNLPRILEKKCKELFTKKCYEMHNIPLDYPLTDKQKRVRNNKIYKANELNDDLAKIAWPAYYLDFETIKTAYPLYIDVTPHEQVLTQYSLHKLDDLTCQCLHIEYLADPKQDCRRELIEHLLQHIGTTGSIIVYSNFEKTMLSGLKKRFVDLSEQIDSIIHRLIDLKIILEKNYYHPGFFGSYSIKSVLPVLLPNMSYASLDIKNGDEAIAAFVSMAKKKLFETQVTALRQQLLAYCCQDTFAMVELHKYLINC
jgi:hypothetical protein